MRKVTMEVKRGSKVEKLDLSALLSVPKDAYRIEEDNGNITVSFDKNKLRVSDVIEQFMKHMEVSDIKIQETELSEIVKAIYEHGI